MKRIKRLCLIAAVILMVCMLSSCGGEAFRIEDNSITYVDIDTQSNLKLDVGDGNIKIIFWQEENMKVIEKKTASGPAKKEALEERMKKAQNIVESTDYTVSINNIAKAEREGKKEGKSIFKVTNDIELIVPQSITRITIKADNGDIYISGDKHLTAVELDVDSGSISLERLDSEKVRADITKGEINIKELEGAGKFKCGRGSVTIKNMTGEIEAALTEGEISIEKSEGRFDCDISSGEIEINDSWLLPDSVIYASSGMIKADFEIKGETGKIKFMVATGDIRLGMPEKSGWSLLAKATRGSIINKLEQDSLHSSPSDEVYGDVGGGGLLIDAYIDRGNIYLE